MWDTNGKVIRNMRKKAAIPFLCKEWPFFGRAMKPEVI
jgi:hypothetical protein